MIPPRLMRQIRQAILGWGSISAVFSVKNAAAALSLKIGNGAVRRQRILK